MFSGATFGAGAGIATLGAVFGAMITALIRSWVPLRKIETDAESKLRDDLIGRIRELEKRSDLRDQLHAAELALVRHRLNNESQTVDALLTLLRTSDSISNETLESIMKNRERNAEIFAQEMNTITAARLAAAANTKDG